MCRMLTRRAACLTGFPCLPCLSCLSLLTALSAWTRRTRRTRNFSESARTEARIIAGSVRPGTLLCTGGRAAIVLIHEIEHSHSYHGESTNNPPLVFTQLLHAGLLRAFGFC